jgi:putative nucleotidyltransferase with HDIG domain
MGVLGVALSKNALVTTSTDSSWRIFLLVSASFFLIVLIGINLADTITRPLLQLVQASKKVSAGDLNIIVDSQSNDEVSVLTESFNTMVVSLNQSQKHLIQSYDETLEGWARALELRDKETQDHSLRVTNLTVRLAQAMGIEGEALVNIRRGALLHDIGKMGTSDDVLHKNGPLDAKEWKIIQKHPQEGYDLLKQIGFLVPALEVPFCHHEKWDGSGYPRGLMRTEIPISARIFAIVDVFDAMTNDRPYRKAMPVEEVISYLKEQSGSHFDPAVVEKFVQLIGTPG